jgi:hypothetical protein
MARVRRPRITRAGRRGAVSRQRRGNWRWLVHCPRWLAAAARVCDERILLGARKRRSSWCGHGDGQGPASLTFAGAADWLAGWCGVWVCRPGGGRSWGPPGGREAVQPARWPRIIGCWALSGLCSSSAPRGRAWKPASPARAGLSAAPREGGACGFSVDGSVPRMYQREGLGPL